MQILVKVETGFNCDWRNIEPLQPDGFKGQTENEKETLKNSIVKNGFNNAFDVWRHDGKLLSIDGVHRKIALLELAAEGYEIPEQLPCTYVDAKDETEAATIILSRNSQHSHILSAAVMTAAFKIPAATIEAVVPQKNIEAWSENDNSVTEQLTAEEDDFEFEEGGIETDIVLGDLFEIGEHRLLCGDSTCSDTVAKLMNWEKADMVFTDPPYNANYKSRGKDVDLRQGIKNDNMESEAFEEFIKAFVATTLLSIKDGASLYFCCNWKDSYPRFYFNLLDAGVNISANIVWNKGSGGMGWQDYRYQYEFIIYGFKKGAAHSWYAGRSETDIWDFNRDGRSEYKHPTQKPIQLSSKAITNSSKSDDLVLDLFLGSGSTMVAAHQLNRKCYGMELDPKYCQVIIDRMRKLDPTLVIKKNGVIYE